MGDVNGPSGSHEDGRHGMLANKERNNKTMLMLQAENGGPAGTPREGLSTVSRARATTTTTTTTSTTGRWRGAHSVANADGADALALALALARHDAVLHDVASSASAGAGADAGTNTGTNAGAVAGASGRDV
ncbi:hypothetical protein E4U25_002156 [Claviceps purpurea]|nr:hypothetical protein E4U25_002156 [Claviceps purpurea]